MSDHTNEIPMSTAIPLKCPVCKVDFTLPQEVCDARETDQRFFHCPNTHSLWFMPKTLKLAECTEDEIYHWLLANPEASGTDTMRAIGASSQKASRWIQYMRDVGVRP